MEVASVQLTSHEAERGDNNNNNDSPETLEASLSSASVESNKKNNKNSHNNATINDVSSNDKDEEDEEEVCRICRNPGDSGNPLRYPCACKGTMKFVHQDCLLQWLNHRKGRHCEVCRHAFSFSPVYALNAPTRLRLSEFVVGIAMKACRVLHFFLPPALLLGFFLLILPFVTIWIWRLSFVRSLGEAKSLFLSHISATEIVSDYFSGFLLHLCVECITVGTSYLWVYFRYLLELGGQDAARENDGGGNGARAPRGPLALVDRIHAVHHLVAHVEQMLDRDDADIAEVVRLIVAFFGMQGPISHLIRSTLIGIAVNIIYLGGLVLMPFSFGRIILRYISRGVEVAAETLNSNTTGLEEASDSVGRPFSVDLSSYLSDATILATGYMFIILLVLLYFGGALVIRRRYGIGSIAHAYIFLIRQFLTAVRHFMTKVKIAFVLVMVFGVFTLTCGWWLDVCTIEMLGKTISQRVESFSDSPLASSLIHWMVGFLYLLLISIFDQLQQEVLQNGVFHVNRNTADSNHDILCGLIDEPVHKFARNFLLSVSDFGLLTVLLVFLPVKLATRLAPSIFPLDIFVSDPFTEIPTAMLLLWIFLPFAQLRATIKALLLQWFTAVCWALGLTYLLLPSTDIGGQENVNVERQQDRQHYLHRDGAWQEDQAPIALIAAGDPNRHIDTSSNFDVQEDNDGHQTDSVYDFVFCIVLLRVSTWTALLLFNTALIVVPISLGRALLNSITLLPITRGVKCNDLYAFIFGSYAIWIFLVGVRYFIEHVKAGRMQTLKFSLILKWFGIVLKSSALLLIWILVIPVLIGLLFELLVMVPIRVSVDESPVFLLHQNWALGLFFLQFWTELVMLDPRMALVDESWRIKFQKVRVDGFSRLQALSVLEEILIPITVKLLTLLCVPYVIARGMFLVLGYPLTVNSAVYRFAWVGYLTITSLQFYAKRFHVWYTNLHNSVRDDIYVTGRQLRNYGEVEFAKRDDSAAETISESGDAVSAGLVQHEHEGDIGARHEAS